MFASAAAFDPDSIDDVHVTISKSTGPTLFAASLMSARAFWSQPNAPVKKWIYKDLAATVGVKKALLKESPPRERDVPLQDDGHERQHRRAARAPHRAWT